MSERMLDMMNGSDRMGNEQAALEHGTVRTAQGSPAWTAADENSHLVLFICKSFTGEIVRVSVRADRSPVEAIPDIADQIEYSTPDWEKIGMYNLTRDFEYDLDVPFSDTRTQSGDLVIMADGAGCHKSG